MDFEQSEEQRNLRTTVRRLFQDRATPEVLSRLEASDDGFHRELWKELAELGLLGVSTSEELGGAGLGVKELMVLVEEVGSGVPAIPFLASVAIAAPTIEAFGSTSQRAALAEHAAGTRVYTASGANPAENQSPLRARRDGDRSLLSGTCSLVPFGPIAQTLLVPAATGAGTSLFLLDLESANARVERQRVTSHEVRGRVELDDCEAEPLGEAALGPEALAFFRTRSRLAWCGFATGLASRAIELTAGYVRERKQFGVPVGSFQAVAQRIADAYIELEAMRLTLARAVYQVSAGEDAREALAVASYCCAEGVHQVTYACQHLHGGVGVDRTYPLFRYYLHGRQAALALGGAQSRLAEIGDLLAEA